MENIINQIDGQVQVIFERISDQGLVFRDALWLSQQDYSNTTAEQILQLQEERYSNWLLVISAPVVEDSAPEVVEE
jgi:hypothetical protein